MPKRSRDGASKGSSSKKRRMSKSAGSRSGRSSASLAPETKYFDTTFAAAVNASDDWATTHVAMTSFIDSDGVTITPYTGAPLNPSVVGPGYGQVVGTKYLLKKIAVKGELVPGAAQEQADMQGSRTVRIVLVEDTQPNGAQATGDLVFTDLGSAAQCNHSFLAMGASGNGRFRIIKDKTYVLQPATAGTDNTNTNSLGWTGTTFKMSYSPKKAVPIRIKGTATTTPTVASLTDRAYFLLAHASSSSPAVSMVGAARAYYVD